MRNLLAGAALCACAAGAGASPTWQFWYTGLVDAATGRFDPSHTVQGSFSGDDADGDGAIGLFELHSLVVDGRQYVGCGQPPQDYYARCAINRFSYGINGALFFDVKHWGNDEYAASWGGTVVTGDRTNEYAYGYDGDTDTTWLWNEQTRFAIAGPVPEPAAGAMLAVGLCCLAGITRRRRPA